MNSQETDKDINLLHNSERQTIKQRSVNTLTSNYDISYHRLELKVDPAVRFIEGMVCTYFEPKTSDFNTMYFDFRNNMIVDSVKYGFITLSYSFNTSVSLQVNFPNNLVQNVLDSVKIYYHGVPINDGFGSFSTSTTSCGGTNNKIMWTLSEPYGAKTWWPCKETLNDKADSIDMIVTCPQPYRVGSNGILISEVGNSDTTTTYFWKHRYPIPAYLVAFAVSDYSVYYDKVPVPGSVNDTIDVLNYVFPCSLSVAQNNTPNLIPVMQYFIETFGAYPYENEKYGHAQFGWGGGMEHATMTFLSSFGISLMSHELAHQWFGDKITCGSWQDIWLNEGFATYLDGLTCEQGIGYTSWNNWKITKINHVTGNNYGSTYVYDTSGISNIFNSRLVYSKGALILHMLRWVMGDTDFFQGMNNYINDPGLAYNYAITSNFKNHMEIVSGLDLDEFFNDWLYGEGWPNYDIKWAIDNTCEKLYININQTHSSGSGTFFEMPVPIKFFNSTKDTTIIFYQNSPQDTFFVAEIDFIPTNSQFDPDKWLCAKNLITNIAFNNERYKIWTGIADDDWNNDDNWDCGGVPDANDTVMIPLNKKCKIYSGNIGECKKLKVDPNSVLNIDTNAVLNIYE